MPLFFMIASFNAFSQASCPVYAETITIEDDFGAEVVLEKPATRIICLYGALNDMLLAMGGGDALAARTAAETDNPALVHLPAIGTHMRPNAELIAALKPDLVLQMAGRTEAITDIEYLRGLGIKALIFAPESIDDLLDLFLKLGKASGREDAAQKIIEDWRERLAVLKDKAKDHTPLKIFYESRYPNLLGAGERGIINDIIMLAGGENVVKIPKKLARLNEEILIAADPDLYLMQKGPMNPNPQPLQERLHFRKIKALQAGCAHIVDEKMFARPGPGSIDALEKLAEWISECRNAKKAMGLQ